MPMVKEEMPKKLSYCSRTTGEEHSFGVVLKQFAFLILKALIFLLLETCKLKYVGS